MPIADRYFRSKVHFKIRAFVLFSGMVVVSMAALDRPAHSAQVSGTAKVVDGDTFDVGAVRVRLHGIDAPEAGQSCRRANGKSWACGTEATNRLAELVAGHNVDCDALERDQYGRVVAVCRADGTDLNRTMIENGLAWAFIKYSDDYATAEARARDQELGIWQGEAEAPWDYRENKWARAVEASPGGCPIKGNISSSGERIYHTPWSPWYSRTKINEGNGERWFCDEDEAQQAGWRAPYWK